MLPLKDPTLLKTQSLIDNQWVDAVDRTTIDVTNPFVSSPRPCRTRPWT